MIDLQAAEQLLDFSRRLGNDPSAHARAREQLAGAVAIHNLLEKNGVAYLADEVGMGKTYVALGAMALFRHFKPNFRVMVVSPRRNIQQKWVNELRNFIEHNVLVSDLRVRGVDGRPARPTISCDNLLELVSESVLDPDRDFFGRITSFSLGLGGKNEIEPDAAARLRDAIRKYVPWLSNEVFDLRNRQKFKDNVAQAICCALPVFDLLIVDEGHNLKHGFRTNSAARNRVMALAFGHPTGMANSKLFPGYGPRAKRVLFLSATPIEESYTHLWNQLEIFGLGEKFPELISPDVSEDDKKKVAGRFLVRRVTAMDIGGSVRTRNMYRREWRHGGVKTHDEPIVVQDDRRRLVVALIQKKVSELLQHERFGACFQMGMLASFESFLETAKLKTDESPFDDAEQAERADEREGIDIDNLNSLARSYRKAFDGAELPHPKMDELVDSLRDTWRTGRKALVFVRRVASVKEIKRKLDERYNDWLIARVRADLPVDRQVEFDEIVRRFRRERAEGIELEAVAGQRADALGGKQPVDEGGRDTFFAWFFRGAGPKGAFSGARLQERLQVAGSAFATFFEDNYVAWVLECSPAQVSNELAQATGVPEESLREMLQARSARFLPGATKLARGDRFLGVQAAAVDWLRQLPGAWQERASAVWFLKLSALLRAKARPNPPEIDAFLNEETFFTRLEQRPALRERLFPLPGAGGATVQLRERELRRELLQAASRLGHAFVDLYVTVVQGTNFSLRGAMPDVEQSMVGSLTGSYLDLLERQFEIPLADRESGWGAFDELSQIAECFQLILDQNLPGLRNAQDLSECPARVGQLFGSQQPVGGMSGKVNQTLIRQFRLPGYPFVLVTTDLLQEGEDLHTFCDSVFHYGISWTPSAMEQRTGRIDRVLSLSERRLSGLDREPSGDEKLQVYFPYLRDTVELLQVKKVFGRMDTFLRLMHSNLAVQLADDRKVNTREEFARSAAIPLPMSKKLESAFPIQEQWLKGSRRTLAVSGDVGGRAQARLRRLTESQLDGLAIEWESSSPDGVLLGTAQLGSRQQPLTLYIQSRDGRLCIRCVSPIGRVVPDGRQGEILDALASVPARVGLAISRDGKYDLTVEDVVPLGLDDSSDSVRVGQLLRRVIRQADELERLLMPGADASLNEFTPQLETEFRDGR